MLDEDCNGIYIKTLKINTLNSPLTVKDCVITLQQHRT